MMSLFTACAADGEDYARGNSKQQTFLAVSE